MFFSRESFLALIKALLAGLAAVWVCIAQDINISGIVTDTGDSPIAGAVVQLENRGLPTTTGADGRFTIANTVGINGQINTSISHNLSARADNGLLYIIVAEKSPVAIVIYNLRGEVISAIQKTMGVGAHAIALPYRGAGVYLCKIKTGNNELIIKNALPGYIWCGRALRTYVSTTTVSSGVSKRHVPINDVIAVAKDGYLNYRVTVTNLDTSNIAIKLIVCADTVIDIDGNVYQAVQIGEQVWTVKDLRVTRYNDGSAIVRSETNAEWAASFRGTAAYCFYDNDSASYADKYGALYNWYAVNTGKLAPKGWHVPDNAEWETLRDYLIVNGYNWDGTTDSNKIAKSMSAQADWNSFGTTGAPGYDIPSNNRSGFSAMPSGFRDHFNEFGGIGMEGFWWSSTVALYGYHCGIYCDYVDFLCKTKTSENILDNCPKGYGFSVRLVRD